MTGVTCSPRLLVSLFTGELGALPATGSVANCLVAGFAGDLGVLADLPKGSRIGSLSTAEVDSPTGLPSLGPAFLLTRGR